MIVFLVVPIIELYLFVEVSAAIGFGSALVWIVGVSIIGAWLVKREGLNALRRANAKVVAGEIPADEMITGILVLLAGALLLTPGFLTDGIGLLVLFPPTRALLRRRLRSRLRYGPIVIGGRFGAGNGTFGPSGGYGSQPHGDVMDVDSWEESRRRGELE